MRPNPVTAAQAAEMASLRASIPEAEAARDLAAAARVVAQEAALKVEAERDAVAAELVAYDALDAVDAKAMVAAENARRKHRRLQTEWEPLAAAYRSAERDADDAQHRLERQRRELSTIECAVASERNQKALADRMQEQLMTWASTHGVQIAEAGRG